MLPITVLSDRPQPELLRQLSRALEHTHGDFLLREHISRSPLTMERGVLIIRDIRAFSRVSVSDAVVPVIESGCTAAVRLAAAHSLRPVCCGMSARDTLTAESISDGRALVCLQRAIPTVSGTDRQPCQLVALTGGECTASELLLTVGTLLACGDERSEVYLG